VEEFYWIKREFWDTMLGLEKQARVKPGETGRIGGKGGSVYNNSVLWK
jgi:hypothetical protein